MKLHVAILLAGTLSVSGLTGCGGGGGNPGACIGSAEVCQGRQSSDVPQNEVVPSTPGNPAPGTATCSSFATQAEAQIALGNGELQLDPNGDGIACNE